MALSKFVRVNEHNEKMSARGKVQLMKMHEFLSNVLGRSYVVQTLLLNERMDGSSGTVTPEAWLY